MSEYFPKPKPLGGTVKIELDLPNYATKADFKNAAGVDLTSLTLILVGFLRVCFALGRVGGKISPCRKFIRIIPET